MELINHCEFEPIPTTGHTLTPNYYAAVDQVITPSLELHAESRHLRVHSFSRHRAAVQVRLQQHHRPAPRPHLGPQQGARRERAQGGAAPCVDEL